VKIHDTYVFGAFDGGWFKMVGVNASGTATAVRYTNSIKKLEDLTAAIWNAKMPYTNKGSIGFYNVKDITLSGNAP
jgi:hypothetical protein